MSAAHIRRSAHTHTYKLPKTIKNRNYFQFTPQHGAALNSFLLNIRFGSRDMLFSFSFAFISQQRRLSVRCSLFHFHFGFFSTRILFHFGRKVKPSCQLAIISYIKNHNFFFLSLSLSLSSLIYSHKYFVSVLMLPAYKCEMK